MRQNKRLVKMKAFENIRQTGIDISEDLKAYLEKIRQFPESGMSFSFLWFHGLLLYRISTFYGMEASVFS